MAGREPTPRIEPATLHKVMQETIGFGLKKRYQPQQEIPHELLVLILQMDKNADGKQEPGTGPAGGGRHDGG